MADLEKVYNPTHVEDKWYSHWMDKKYFSADPNSEKEPYTIVIPPPNVTGMLTVGHVLNNTIQDILIRKARMEGKEACWIPGTCLLYTSPSPRDGLLSRMPSSA